MQADAGGWNGFLKLAKKEGIARVVFAATVLPMMLWQGSSAFLHRYRIEHSGDTQSAVVEHRILKHCYGFRCSSPVFFEGEVGSPAYDDFAERCGKACWWLIQYRFSWAGKDYSITEPVYPNRFEKLPPGSRVAVNVDASDPFRSELNGSTKDSGIIFALYLVGGFGGFIGLLVLGNTLNKLFYGQDGYNSR